MSDLATAQAPATTEERRPDSIESNQPAEEGTKPDDKLSAHYATIARKEKALRAQAQQLKAEKEALKAEQSKYQTDYVSKAELAKKFKEDPMGAMSEYGMTYDQLTQLALNQPGPQDQAISKLEAKILELEGKLSGAEAKRTEDQQKSYEQALNQIRNEAKILIDSDETYETIKSEGEVETVVELIKQTFDETGNLLTVEEAAKQVEDYLFEKALKTAQLKKVQAKLQTPPSEATKAPEGTQKAPIKTLTNATGSSKPMSPRERAMLAFKGQLTK